MRTRRQSAAPLIALLAVITCTATAPTAVVLPAPQSAATVAVTLPNKDGALRFAVLGDFGTGSREQYQMADTIARVHSVYPFELMTLVGDNLYGSERPQNFKKKFEIPYKPLIDAGVKFYASLGNHDSREEQRNYKLFNMDGKLYYSFKAPRQNVRFFVLDSTYLDKDEISWLEKELAGSNEHWKIAYFHHPPYSSGDRHGSDTQLRTVIEPLFIRYNVSVVLAGHDHFYERIKPQNGIVYFVVGSGGQLRRGNIDKRSALTAKGFDTDQAFMVAEIDGDEMSFNAISRTGAIVDSGTITRRK